MFQIKVFPGETILDASSGENLLALLRRVGLMQDAPCGGHGTCGKCVVVVNGQRLLACRTVIDRDMTVMLPEKASMHILTHGLSEIMTIEPHRCGYLLAVDIGTTTLAMCLMDPKKGETLAQIGRTNPQTSFGADVISRIQCALKGHLEELTSSIRSVLSDMIREICRGAGITPDRIGVVSVVGNPAMQQFFLGISPVNLAQIPFAHLLTKTEIIDAARYLPDCINASLLIVPDISGYIGADTLGCILATQMDRKSEFSLLIDIGTNGEMVIGNTEKMVACSTAAGPALEGANIQFGMRARLGAIDHVWTENGSFCCSVIGGGEAKGICGSGLVDAVAAALDLDLINERGKILCNEGIIPLTDHVHLTQEDIRQVQMAKGAIAAGIELMARYLDIRLTDIKKVYLAGAFGSYMEPASACRIGLLPMEFCGKIIPVGNAALEGAKRLACSKEELAHSQEMLSKVEFLELAAVNGFPRSYAKNMRF